MTRASYIDPRTGDTYPVALPRWCSDAGTPLMITPQPGISRSDIDFQTRSLWRYQASLPVQIANPITMGEGCTPLVRVDWGHLRPAFKLEFFAPTASFKDRGASVMLSFLRQLGIASVLEDSSGNGGAAVAAYGAAGGIKVKVLAPSDTSVGKIAQMRAYGAEVELVPGPREASQAEALRQAVDHFYASHNWHPFFLEGTKSLAYEIWEDLGFRAPDNVIIPVGAGSSLLGCYIGFKELQSAGQIKRLPRLFAVQPLNCSPVDANFRSGGNEAVARPVYNTIAEGTAIKVPLRLREMLSAIRETDGGTVAVSENEITSGLRRLAANGIFAEPTSATAAVALDHLLATKKIAAHEETVVIITGSGLKAASSMMQIFQD